MPRRNDEQTVKDALQGRDIANLTATLTSLASQMKEGFEGVHARQDKTNGRIGRLENWRWFITGGLAIIVVLVLPVIFIVVKTALESHS